MRFCRSKIDKACDDPPPLLFQKLEAIAKANPSLFNPLSKI